MTRQYINDQIDAKNAFAWQWQKTIHKFIWTGFTLLAICSQASAQVNIQGRLKAAVVKVDITPDEPKMLLGYAARQSTGIYDRIHHKMVVLDDGNTRFYLVSSDICLVSPSEYDYVAALLQKKLGIDPLQFWWSVTHTHSAPEVGVPGLPAVFLGDRYKHNVDTSYTRLVEETLIKGLEEAIQKLEPVTLGVGWGFSQANINRRTWGTDNKAAFGMNADGAVDRKIGLLRLEKQDGSLMALIANYAIHSTVLGPQNLKISGDVTGNVASYIEEKTGAPLLFINGAAGNMAPIYSVYPSRGAGQMAQYNVLLGDRILQANQDIFDTYDSVKLYTGELVVQTPRKETMTRWPEDLKKYTSVAADKKTNLVNLPVRFLRINDAIAIWSAPLELFCEISNNVRDASPYPYTFYFGYTNGWLGYLSTAAAWEQGGYEVHGVSPYVITAEKDVTTAVTNYLQSDEITRPATKRKAKTGKRK